VTERGEVVTQVLAGVAGARERAAALLSTLRHGTDDAPYFVALDIARLPAPYAIAVTAAMCQEMKNSERPGFVELLLEVAKGEYRSVFD
jgi:hypothetical protein